MNIAEIDKLNDELQGKSSLEILDYFITNYTDKIGFATSLGLEDQVITQMIFSLKKKIKIFTLDTGRIFPETYDLIDKTKSRYKMDIDIYFPDFKQVEEMVKTKGVNLFYESIENRKLCCGIRRVEPLKRALSNLDIWISGLRRDQSPTRSEMQIIEWDATNGLVKVNPLIDCSEKDCWNYVKKNNIPYNALHDKGFPSIGCQPCTRAVKKGENIRAGRWWWENPNSKECGLHKR